MYHSRKIGVFISHLFGEYQHNLCQGILDTAKEYGYLVEIFASTDGETPNTLAGEEGILTIPSYQDFDGIIFANGTYPEYRLADAIYKQVTQHCSCPVLVINQEAHASNYVILDNNAPFADLTEHFITVHHAARICYLGCRTESQPSDTRYVLYKETLAKHNIPCPDENVFQTFFGMEYAREALTYFCKDGIPDAILCYNDRMALDMMLAANERGLRIPDDIAISGCDNSELGRNITPTLTTVTFPTYEMGQEAVHKLLRMTDGILDDAPSVIKAAPVIGCSCGCHYRVSEAPYYAITQMHEIEHKERRIFQDIHMSAVLHEITDLEEGMEKINDYVKDIAYCSELYICLYENWDSAPRHIRMLAAIEQFGMPEEDNMDENTDKNIVNLCFGWQQGQEVPPCSFAHQDILPPHIVKDSQSSYICVPLYFEDKQYGYVVLAFEDNRLHYDFHVTSWINNISRMLKRVADNHHMSLLAARLEDIYMKDELTGLYNYRGFRAMASMIVDDMIVTGAPLLMISFDIEHLKDINKDWGHEEGDFALQVFSSALKTTFEEDVILARTGDDEFSVLLPGLEKADAKEYISHICQYLTNYARLHHKKYQIHASYACDSASITCIEDLDGLLHSCMQQLEQNPSTLL